MTQVAEAVVASDWPTTDLYYSPRGLYDFQAEGIADGYLSALDGGGRLVVWDTGTGKTHFGMRLMALLAEDARDGGRPHDLSILVCEKGKLLDWRDDLQRYTRLSVRVHHGPNRLKKLEAEGLPDVLVTTYETAKADLAKTVKAKRGTTMIDGPLMTAIRGKHVTWIGDEFGKLRNRSAATYKAFDRTFRQMRKAHPKTHRVFGLTATPIERDWEDAFNQFRLIRPDLMPGVGEFEKMFIRGRDPYGRPRYQPPEIMAQFVAMARPIILRKRKTDPDVVAQFPSKVEESAHIEMGPEQRGLYDLVASLAYPDDEDGEPGEYQDVPGLWTLLRQIADHPASLVRSAQHGGTSALTRMVVQEFGEQRLVTMPCAKEDRLVEHLTKVVHEQGEKAVVFTFFGQSVLPVLAFALRRKGFTVFENHGGLTSTEMHEVRTAFKSHPQPCVFLTSDAGARGLNLPEATYVVEYESALTYANRTQRLDRIHRIDSLAPSVHCLTLVTNESVEVAILENLIKRNQQTDLLLDDEDAGENFMTAEDRRAALGIGRLKRKTRP